MRSVCRRFCRGSLGWSAALILGALAWLPPTANAGAPPGMPLVLPQQSLASMAQLNSTMQFTVVCLSQVPAPGEGAATPTAVIDLSAPGGAAGPGGSLPFFMFPQDVPIVQQLNGGMLITPVATSQVPSGGSAVIPVVQVNISMPSPAPSPASSAGCLLVCPVPSLPLLGQLNPGLRFDVLCTSQGGTGQANPAAQTALLNIQPAAGTGGPSQPLPILLPVDTLPTLGQLNAGASMDVINVIEMPIGSSSAVLPVALVDIQQNPQALAAPNSSVSTDNSEGQGDDHPGKGNGNGNGQGKGNGKGKGKGNDKGKGKG